MSSYTVLLFRTVGESSISQTGADRQHAPAFHVLHDGHLGQPLHHAVIVHDDGRVVPSDLRNGFDQTCRQVEPTALPITGQILRPLLDRAVVLDDAGACDAYERRELEPFVVRLRLSPSAS